MPANCLSTAHPSSSGEEKLSKVQPFLCTEPELLPRRGDGRFRQQRSTAWGRRGLSAKPLATPRAAGAEGKSAGTSKRENTVSSDVRTGGMETSKKAGQDTQSCRAVGSCESLEGHQRWKHRERGTRGKISRRKAMWGLLKGKGTGAKA